MTNLNIICTICRTSVWDIWIYPVQKYPYNLIVQSKTQTFLFDESFSHLVSFLNCSFSFPPLCDCPCLWFKYWHLPCKSHVIHAFLVLFVTILLKFKISLEVVVIAITCHGYQNSYHATIDRQFVLALLCWVTSTFLCWIVIDWPMWPWDISNSFVIW